MCVYIYIYIYTNIILYIYHSPEFGTTWQKSTHGDFRAMAKSSTPTHNHVVQSFPAQDVPGTMIIIRCLDMGDDKGLLGVARRCRGP